MILRSVGGHTSARHACMPLYIHVDRLAWWSDQLCVSCSGLPQLCVHIEFWIQYMAKPSDVWDYIPPEFCMPVQEHVKVVHALLASFIVTSGNYQCTFMSIDLPCSNTGNYHEFVTRCYYECKARVFNRTDLNRTVHLILIFPCLQRTCESQHYVCLGSVKVTLS